MPSDILTFVSTMRSWIYSLFYFLLNKGYFIGAWIIFSPILFKLCLVMKKIITGKS